MSLKWETETIVRHNGKQHSHDNKMLENEMKKMVDAAVDEAANNLIPTINPRSSLFPFVYDFVHVVSLNTYKTYF